MALRAYYPATDLGALIGTERTKFLDSVIADVQSIMFKAGEKWPVDIKTYDLEGAIKVADATIGYLISISEAFKAATAADDVDLVTIELHGRGKLREWADYIEVAFQRFRNKYTRNRGKENLSTAKPPLSLTELRDIGAVKVQLPDFRKDVMLTLKNGIDVLANIRKELSASDMLVIAGLNWAVSLGGKMVKFAGDVVDFGAIAIKKAAETAGDVLDTTGDVLGAAADLLVSLPTLVLVGGGAFLWFKWDERKKRKERWSFRGLGQTRGGSARTWAAAMTALGYGGAKVMRYATGDPPDEGALATLAKLTIAGWLAGFAAGAVLKPPGGTELPAVAGALGGFYDAVIGPRVSPLTGTAVSAGLGFFLAQPTSRFLLRD